MTEKEWLECEEVRPLLEYLVGRTSDRKFRLFGCACCRRVWSSLVDERSKRAVEVAERYVDGLATEEEVESTRKAMVACRNESAASPPVYGWVYTASLAVLFETPSWKPNAASQGAFTAAWTAAEAAWRANSERGPEPEAARQLLLLRDIFENPYRPGWVDPAWLAWNGARVVNLAQAIYDERAFDRLPVLADALEKAGCGDQGLLGHCRGPGPHVRGCWVLDLLLERE